MSGEVQRTAPVASSKATTYGPAQLGSHAARATRATAAYTIPPATVTELLMPPPDGTLPSHTSARVPAFRAKPPPPLEPANRQPSATVGVPVKSPEPPAPLAENVQAGPRVAASTSPMVRSRSWKRVLDGSWPMLRHSPPVTLTGPQPATGDGCGPMAARLALATGRAMSNAMPAARTTRVRVTAPTASPSSWRTARGDCAGRAPGW